MEKEQLFLIEKSNQFTEKERGEQKNHYYGAIILIDTGIVHHWMLKLMSKGKQDICIVSKYIFSQINIY